MIKFKNWHLQKYGKGDFCLARGIVFNHPRLDDGMYIHTSMVESMGAVILSGGAKGKRNILPHSEVMIHQPSSGVEGQATDIILVADHISRTRETLNKILSENCGKPLEEVVCDTERDYWMNASEALNYGIVDGII